MTSRFSANRTFALAVLLGALIGCSDETTTNDPYSPLADLAQAVARDSLGGTPTTQPPGEVEPGYFRGTVLGPSLPGAGNDSLATAPRVAGAVVSAYQVFQVKGGIPVVDEPIAEVVTGADGKFTLPTLPGGDYVVTINPPAGSGYSGVWVTARAYSQSHVNTWWVVLPKP